MNFLLLLAAQAVAAVGVRMVHVPTIDSAVEHARGTEEALRRRARELVELANHVRLVAA